MNNDDKSWKDVLYAVFAFLVGMLLAVIFLALAAGCSTQMHTSTEQNRMQSSDERLRIVRESHRARDMVRLLARNDSAMMHTRIHIRVYDTSRLKDSETGYHPLLKDIDIDSSRTELSQTDISEEEGEKDEDVLTIAQDIERSDSILCRADRNVAADTDSVISAQVITFFVVLLVVYLIISIRHKVWRA